MRPLAILLLCLAIPVDAWAQRAAGQSNAVAYRWVRDTLSGAKLPCQEPTVAPYERLLPFAEPRGILARVAAARLSTAER
jgi:hypothetical protein